MNLIELSERNQSLLQNIGIEIKDKKCSKDEILRYENKVMEHIMHQSKLKIPAEISKYDSILKFFSNSENK